MEKYSKEKISIIDEQTLENTVYKRNIHYKN